MQPPSAREINPVPEDLDGQYAERHFCGKTVHEAVVLFKEGFSIYLEDLMHMGVGAFVYYVPAAIQFADSGDARHECEVARSLLGVLNHRWNCESSELGEVRELFHAYCEGVLARIGEMETECHFDHRLERQFRRFLGQLSNNE